MGKKKNITIGYKYFLGVHFVLSHGELDSLVAINVDDRSAWTGVTTGGNISIAADELFGGEKREGGVSGVVSFLPGSTTQTQNPYLVSVLGNDVPYYRRVASVILNQTYVGTNPYLKKWSFRVRRIMKRTDGSAQWYPAKAAIGVNMNPAHIIRECLTDSDWGMGYTSNDIDEASFQAAADTLFAEEFGLSVLWDRQATIEDFIKDMLRHIDASLYVDKAQGKFVIYLIRADYSVPALRTVDENIILEIEDYTCSTFTELSNSVTVNFWDSSTGKNSSLTAQDIAMVQLQGATVSTTMEYGGCPNGELAAKLATRDLRALSTPLTRCVAYCTREAANLVPGSPVKFSWADYGVTDLIMRVASIDFGTATENQVKLTLLQDVFALTTATYAPPPPTSWVPISNFPQPVVDRMAVEAPYYMLVMNYGQEKVDERLTTLPNLGHVVAAGKRPTSDSVYAETWTDDLGYFEQVVTLDFCPFGKTAGALSYTDTVINLTGVSDLYVDMLFANDYALIGSEIVVIRSFTGNTLTVGRGVFDTVPSVHTAGSNVFVFSNFHGLSDTEYVEGETVNVKITPVTSKGILAIGSAPSSSVTMAKRALRPYVPGNFKIESQYYPSGIVSVTGTIDISWSSRNRLTQTGSTVYDFMSGAITAEVGTTYTVRLTNIDTYTVISTTTGITASTVTVTMPSGLYTAKIELWSECDGISSYQKHSATFIYLFFHGNLTTEAGDIFVTEDNNFEFALE